MLIPNYNTLADAIDRLIVTCNKLSWFENNKRVESLKSDASTELIAHWDRLSRNECEYRNLLKVEINKILSTLVEERRYESLGDNRTFAAPSKSVADIIDEMACAAPERVRKELAEAFADTLREI